MSIENAISTADAVEKLRNLEKYLPQMEPTIYEYGRFLAERMGNEKIVPMGFSMLVELALYDLRKGINGYTGEPLKSKLVGYPLPIYVGLSMMTVSIAKAVFPEDFAKGVEEFVEKVKSSK